MREFIPLCMTREELEAWRAANRAVPRKDKRVERPCADCTLEFASAMRLEYKCNGTPRTRGRAPSGKHDERRLLQFREAQARRRAGIRIRRNPQEAAAVRAQIVALYAEGLRTREVAARVGVSTDYAREARRLEAA